MPPSPPIRSPPSPWSTRSVAWSCPRPSAARRTSRPSPSTWPRASARKRALTESLGSAPTAPELCILERETLENVRLQQSRVFEVEGQLVLKVEVSFRFSMGAELGGLYIAPEYRRRGYATHALGHLSRQLLASLPLLTMRAADALAGAAPKAGYQSGPAMQLLVTDRK